MTNESEEITAILLAGGQGSRMGYQDKAWVSYQRKPLVQHVIDALEPQVNRIIVSENSNHPAWLETEFRCVADDESQGPLSGILSCTEWVSTPWTLVVPCDIPNLPRHLSHTLLSNIADREIAVAQDDHGQQNLVFLARTNCLGSIKDYLAGGHRSVHRWLDSRASKAVVFDGTFSNINELGQLNH